MTDVVGFLERIPNTLILLLSGTIILLVSFLSPDVYLMGILHGIVIGLYAGAIGIFGAEIDGAFVKMETSGS